MSSGRFTAPPSNSLDGVARLTMTLPPGVSVARGPGLASSVAVSPDGRTMIVAGTSKDGEQLYRRQLDRLEATPLAGTERGSSPFFSWDGAWVGFVADGRVKRVQAAGGTAVDITPLSGFPAGASWGPDDRIVFAYGAEGGVARRRRAWRQRRGGDRRRGRPKSGRAARRRHHLVRARPMGLRAQPVDRTNDAAGRGGQSSLCARTGHRESWVALLAAPMDVSRHELTGPVVPLVQGVAREPGTVGVHDTTQSPAMARSRTYLVPMPTRWYSHGQTAPSGA